MTEKELHRLKPKDLVALLLQQTTEILQLYERVEKKHAELKAVTDENENLKEALNESDAEIEELKKKLDETDFNIRSLTIEKDLLMKDQNIPLENAGSLIDAANKLTEIFVTAQQEADRHMNNKEIPPSGPKARDKSRFRVIQKETPPPAERKPATDRINALIPGTDPDLLNLVKDGVLQLEQEEDQAKNVLDEIKNVKKAQSTE